MLNKPSDESDVLGYLKKCGAESAEFHNGKVNVTGKLPKTRFGASRHVNIAKAPQFVENGRLQVEFGTCFGDFICRGTGLTSLIGSPDMITGGGTFDCTNNPITSFDGAPRIIKGNFHANLTNVTSLEGIADIFDEVDGDFFFPERKIIKGGLGLILIPGITEISCFSKPFQIIAEYLGKPDDIFECQMKLLDAGLEEFAIL